MIMCSDLVVIVYNGEIYNMFEFVVELKVDGVVFCGYLDIEVILYFYEKYGEVMLNCFNGIFVFVIWDKWKEYLFVVCD